MTRTAGRRSDGASLLAALDQRLTAAAVTLGVVPSVGAGASRPAELLQSLVRLCRDTGRADARWLLLTALYGAFPTPDQVEDLGRTLELSTPARAEAALLADVILDGWNGRVDLPMTVVEGGTLVDVDFSARHDTHTGIHRVVRETVPRWAATHPVHAVAWTGTHSAFRALSAREEARIFSFGTTVRGARTDRAPRPQRLIVPWHSVVVLAEVPDRATSPYLAGLAQYSGNELAMIGYDMIPITSAETRPPIDAITFAGYLTVVKHAHRLAGISRSACAEFAGFAHSVTAQGLRGPEVREVLLAEEPPLRVKAAPRRATNRPVVLCPGTREPHKNQRATLHAAERLWREGLSFEVRLVGGPGWSDEVLRPAVERLERSGRPVVELGRVSDARLTEEMRDARVVVFASLHEGYGLPVAEALATGTPVITADFGSQAEIAALGGCLTVDPRDDDALTDALRQALTDDGVIARLRVEAGVRPVRTWDTYAGELWEFLVAGGVA